MYGMMHRYGANYGVQGMSEDALSDDARQPAYSRAPVGPYADWPEAPITNMRAPNAGPPMGYGPQPAYMRQPMMNPRARNMRPAYAMPGQQPWLRRGPY